MYDVCMYIPHLWATPCVFQAYWKEIAWVLANGEHWSVHVYLRICLNVICTKFDDRKHYLA